MWANRCIDSVTEGLNEVSSQKSIENSAVSVNLVYTIIYFNLNKRKFMKQTLCHHGDSDEQ